MNRAQRVSQAEIRRGFRLIGDTCALGEDPGRWRSHFLLGLCQLVGARVGFCDEEYVGEQPAESRIVGAVACGHDPAGFAGYAAYLEEGGFHTNPMFPAVFPIAHRAWTRTRRELVTDKPWYRSRMVSEYMRSGNVDDSINSRQPIPRPGWTHMCAFCRDWGDRPFSVRERRLVHIVHQELARLWQEQPMEPDPIHALPPRQRQIIARFRAGDSEKQIAFRLGLTRGTVHSYVKALHRKFGISSRFELLAKLSPPPVRNRPRLSIEVTPIENPQVEFKRFRRQTTEVC